MLKWLGIGIALFGSAALGNACGSELERRVRHLEELKKMVIMLEGEIKYAHTPLADAFRHVGKRLKQPFSEFAIQVAAQLEEYEGQPFAEVFAKCIEEELSGTALRKSDLEQLRRLGDNLGYLDVEMQKNTLQLYLAGLNETCEQAAETHRKSARLCRYLGVMGGMFLALVLL